jgi:hypothetical protein
MANAVGYFSACFCRGDLDCRWPAPPIKIAENAATFQPTLLPGREVASASSAFDQRAMAAAMRAPR